MTDKPISAEGFTEDHISGAVETTVEDWELWWSSLPEGFYSTSAIQTWLQKSPAVIRRICQ